MMWKAFSGAMIVALTMPTSVFAQPALGFGSGTVTGTTVGTLVGGPVGACCRWCCRAGRGRLCHDQSLQGG